MDSECNHAMVPNCSIEPENGSEAVPMVPMTSIQSNPAINPNQFTPFGMENIVPQSEEQPSALANQFAGGVPPSPQQIEDHLWMRILENSLLTPFGLLIPKSKSTLDIIRRWTLTTPNLRYLQCLLWWPCCLQSIPLSRAFASVRDSINPGPNSMLEQARGQSSNGGSTRLVAPKLRSSNYLGTGYLEALKLKETQVGNVGTSKPLVNPNPYLNYTNKPHQLQSPPRINNLSKSLVNHALTWTQRVCQIFARFCKLTLTLWLVIWWFSPGNGGNG